MLPAVVAVGLGIIIICALLLFGDRGGTGRLFGEGIMTKSQNPGALTVVLNGRLSLPLVPENISMVPLYHVHKNLWDTIVGEKGAPGLARLINIESDGKLYHFEIRENARFSNGRKITSVDVLFSLERLMGRQPGGHFNAKSTIEKIEVLSDEKFNIRLKERTVSFLFLLSTPEMGVVPKEACDNQGNLKNLSITSGPYTVEGEPETNRLTLVKNKFFTRHDSSSPNQVNLIFPGTVEGIVQAATRDHADLLEAYDSVGIEAFKRLKGNPEYTHTITKPSASFFLVCNPSRLNTSERSALSRLVHEKLPTTYALNSELEKLSSQLLPPKTFGSLSSPPHTGTDSQESLPKKIRFAALNPTMSLPQSVVSLFKNAKIEVEVVGFDSDLSKADVILRGQGMNSDFPEIEFYLAMVSEWAWIPASDEEKSDVMQALHSGSQANRQKLIQKIGSSVLADARVIPLTVRSYAHLYRKDRISFGELANYDGDLPFWRMRAVRE